MSAKLFTALWRRRLYQIRKGKKKYITRTATRQTTAPKISSGSIAKSTRKSISGKRQNTEKISTPENWSYQVTYSLRYNTQWKQSGKHRSVFVFRFRLLVRKRNGAIYGREKLTERRGRHTRLCDKILFKQSMAAHAESIRPERRRTLRELLETRSIQGGRDRTP